MRVEEAQSHYSVSRLRNIQLRNPRCQNYSHSRVGAPTSCDLNLSMNGGGLAQIFHKQRVPAKYQYKYDFAIADQISSNLTVQ